jgi:hypothetical protein
VPPGQGAQTSALHRYRVGTSQPRYELPATQRMPPGMTRYRRDSPVTDIAEQDAPAPSSAGTIRTSRQAPHHLRGRRHHPGHARRLRRPRHPRPDRTLCGPAGRVIARHRLIPAAVGPHGTSSPLSAAPSGAITSQSCIKAALASSVLQRWQSGPLAGA